MKFVSLFAGIGGFDLGFERAGMTPMLQVENDPYPTRVLERHWPDVPRITDVKEVSADDIAEADLICGGFPCQDISVAGKRAGLDGDRSGLWFEFARLVDSARPSWVVVENVAGLLSSNRGEDLATIVGTLADCGYGWAYRVLDSQYFGVAQRRRRVFIVGHIGAGSAAEVLLEPEGLPGDSAPCRPEGQAVAALTANGVGTCGADDNQAQAGHLVAVSVAENQRGELVTAPVTPALAGGGGKPGQGYPAVMTVHTTQDPIVGTSVMHALSTKECGGVYVPDVANTLTSRMWKGVDSTVDEGQTPIAHAGLVRKLTPLECERLQGFPDGWTDNLSDTRRYRALGNAVTVNVAEWIGRRIVQSNEPF